MEQQLDFNEVLTELTNRFGNKIALLEKECAISSVIAKKLQKENAELKEQLKQK